MKNELDPYLNLLSFSPSIDHSRTRKNSSLLALFHLEEPSMSGIPMYTDPVKPSKSICFALGKT